MSAKITNSLLSQYVATEKISRGYRVVPVYRYNSTMGVTAGWRDLNAGHTSFAGVDTSNLSSLSPPDVDHSYTAFPFVQTSVALGHYVPECKAPASLHISLPNLAAIFAKNITLWNDPRLVRDASCLQNATSTITPIYRASKSSATYALTSVLHAVDPLLFSEATYDWPSSLPSGTSVPSNDAMLFRIRVTDYSIGYLPWAVKDSSFSISYAGVMFGDTQIPMNRSTVQEAGLFFDRRPNAAFPNCSRCWPFLATSYFSLPKYRVIGSGEELNSSNPSSCINIAAASNFLNWAYDHNSSLDEYAPISPSSRAKARTELNRLTCNGKVMRSTNYAWLARWQKMKSAMLIGYAVGSGVVTLGVLLVIYNEYLHSRDVKMLAAMVGDADDSPDAELLRGLVGDDADDLPLIIPSEQTETYSSHRGASMAATEAEQIAVADIAIGRLIGSGSFGDVFKATYHRTTVAVKRIALSHESDALATFVQEVRSLQLLKHPNVLRMIGFGIQAPYCYLVSEYCKHKSLDLYFKNHPGIVTFRTRLDWMIDAARGMAFIHSKQVIHRDLKLSNLLLDADMRVKIGDLGTSASGLLGHRTRVGTLDHSAPEILDGKPYDRSCDVYSFGICLWGLFSGLPLYVNYTMFDIITKVTSGQRPAMDTITSPTLASLIQDCWNQDPALRPDFNQVTAALEQMDDSDFQSFA